MPVNKTYSLQEGAFFGYLELGFGLQACLQDQQTSLGASEELIRIE